MTGLRILADDLTGALDCAAAFGPGVPVHLGRAASDSAQGLDIVATATRDVPPGTLAAELAACLPWLRAAGVAFKKVDSLLRGNTFDEVDWLARQAGFAGLAMVPAFPAQGRITLGGQQWWQSPRGERLAVQPAIGPALQSRGWQVHTEPTRPAGSGPMAWVPDVCDDAAMAAVAAQVLQDASTGAPCWLWCGSAGLAHALARCQPAWGPAGSDCPAVSAPTTALSTAAPGPLMLVSASHHAVTRGQWQVLRQSAWAGACQQMSDWPRLAAVAADAPALLLDLAAQATLSPEAAAALLAQQVATIAAHAVRPRCLVVVGGDTLLALCRALGAQGLASGQPLARPGWGCARMRGGRWDGLVCHTRSGAFGGPDDVLQVLQQL